MVPGAGPWQRVGSCHAHSFSQAGDNPAEWLESCYSSVRLAAEQGSVPIQMGCWEMGGNGLQGLCRAKSPQQPASCPVLAKAQRCGRAHRHREPQPGGTDSQEGHTAGPGRAQGAFSERTVTSAEGLVTWAHRPGADLRRLRHPAPLPLLPGLWGPR